eukprot:5614844-Prorocentrum_lima.AAC.1
MVLGCGRAGNRRPIGKLTAWAGQLPSLPEREAWQVSHLADEVGNRLPMAPDVGSVSRGLLAAAGWRIGPAF